MRTKAVVAVIVLAAGAGCTLFESDIPDRSCKSNDDCFQAQGERCDMVAMECVVTPVIDAMPDAAPADAAVDAMVDATVAP